MGFAVKAAGTCVCVRACVRACVRVRADVAEAEECYVVRHALPAASGPAGL